MRMIPSYCGLTQWYLSEASQQIFIVLWYGQVKGEIDKANILKDGQGARSVWGM
jgi:hypothetical protein